MSFIFKFELDLVINRGPGNSTTDSGHDMYFIFFFNNAHQVRYADFSHYLKCVLSGVK